MAQSAGSVWSTAFFHSVARLSAVGVLTGAVTGASLGILVVALSGSPLRDAGGPFLFGLMAGAACALPVVLLCAATGLVVAARAPQYQARILALLLLWPALLTTLALGFFAANDDYSIGPLLVSWAVLIALVLGAVLSTSRWVTAPVSG